MMLMRASALILCVITLMTMLISCSKDPYPYELSDYITVPEDISNIEVSDEKIASEVARRIGEALANSATEVAVVDRGAVTGDTVQLGLACYYLDSYADDRASGKRIEAISDPDCIIKIGSSRHPEKLQEALIGKEAGDVFVVQTVLPDSFKVDNLAGKSVVYECAVTALRTTVLPEYGDAFAMSASGLATVAEYEAMLKKTVREELIFDKLLSLSEIEVYPVDEVNQYSGNFISYYTDLATAAEMTLEEYVAKKFFIELNDFHLQADAYAKESVAKDLLMYYLIRTYDLEITDAEYTEGARRYAERYGLASISALESKFGKDFILKTVSMDKVLLYLASQVDAAKAPAV